MNIRSLRSRLVLAMALIIAAVAGVAGVFSSLTVKREFNRYVVAQSREDAHAALQLFRDTSSVDEAMRRAHAQFGKRSVILDAQQRVVGGYPAEMRQFRAELLPDGALRLTRVREGRLEAVLVQGMKVSLGDGRTVQLVPPRDQRARSFRMAVDRWLIAGLGCAALLAVVVMLTIFARVFRPVEALTIGARALAGGHLDTRVRVRGDDEVAELGRAFNSMAEALERNERARRNMVSDVAHELRTPLTSIRVQIEAVQDGVLEPDARWVASIEEDAAALSVLIDDLQQVSLADAGVLRIELGDVAVDELVDRALTGLERDGVTIARDIAPNLVIRGDARRLVQVIRNLVLNGLAYASARVDVTVVRRDGVVEIRVSDDGPGIPDPDSERVFDRFYRADPSRSRSTGGAGLGLTIARQLVALHGGTIRYERPTFIVALPFISSS
jgi:signal transduction histidine kinase